MLIDWFTVVAQIVNFLVLVLVLWRFLYRPIIRAMSEREAIFASRLEEAERMKQEAVREAETYRHKNQELDDTREDVLAQARREAEAWREELMDKARTEINGTRARWYAAMRQEQDALLRDIRQRVGRQVHAIVRRTLADLASANLEWHLIEVFVQRLGQLDAEQRRAMAGSLRESAQEIVVRSSFEIPVEARQGITDAVREHIAEGIPLRFEMTPELICGIELRAGSHKIAWTVDDYLGSLEELVFEALEEKTEAQNGRERHSPVGHPG